MATVKEQLIKAIRKAATYNPDVQVAPACILWPDKEGQWKDVIPQLHPELPELFTLGDYDSEQKSGPAIWLRCVIAKTVAGIAIPEDLIPIIYIPGFSRQDLRDVRNSSAKIKPIIELQFRGSLWSQTSHKDWTLLAFLKSNQGGLGLNVHQDKATLNAIRSAFIEILDEDVKSLRNRVLNEAFFNELLAGDIVRDVLRWIDQPDELHRSFDENRWQAFTGLCKSQLDFDLEKEGVLAGAQKLAEHKGDWLQIWERYCEAPQRYPNIPVQLRKTRMPADMFTDMSGWPQWNESEEQHLADSLIKAAKLPAHEARKQVIKLEREHAERRELVWADLGEAPLAEALFWLNQAAEITEQAIAAGDVKVLIKTYFNSGWQADDAVLKALSLAATQTEINVIIPIIRAIYLPWLEDSALYLQKAISDSGYPGGSYEKQTMPKYGEGECVIFVDGLRYDLSKRLVSGLKTKGCKIEEKALWAALPTVTATGKPAVSPVRDKIIGASANADFEPEVIKTGASLKGGYQFDKLLKESGWQILTGNETGTVSGKAWGEVGNIDHDGHAQGWKMVRSINTKLTEIQECVHQLLSAGWKKVRIVTDHGWLLMPGGLPKIDLAKALAENKWKRCAAIKSGALSDENMFSWYWNSNQYFALASGISCYSKNVEYTHGGLSLQESLIPELVVTPDETKPSLFSLQITDVVWKGLRCKIAVEGKSVGLFAEIRIHAGDKTSSITLTQKGFDRHRMVSLVVEDETYEGKEVTVVILDGNDSLIAQIPTKVGGGNN